MAATCRRTGGFAQVEWPGRLEILATDPVTATDGAHNGESALRLREALETDFGVAGREVVYVMGANADKDLAAIVRELAPVAAAVVLTPLHSARSATPAQLAALWEAHGVPHSVAPDVPAALEQARHLVTQGAGRLICATGSLYLVGEAREHFGHSYGHDPA